MKDPNIEDVLEVSLLFLTNLLFQCQENKDRLARANGMIHIFHLVNIFGQYVLPNPN